MPRPALTPSISLDDFRGYYWLKEELAEACRSWHLPSGGSKADLSRRIEAYLNKDSLPPAAPRKKAAAMPKSFTRQTVIGTNWRCSQELRFFFEREIGSQFHFNAIMRDVIQNGAGKTLQEAIDLWHANPAPPAGKTNIASQFEYNRHIRDFFKQHPGASLPEAIAAWNQIKSRGVRNGNINTSMEE
jgi:hypothetical protein